MSAFLAVQKASSIEILADGVGFDELGIVREVRSKVELLGDIPAVVIGRGVLAVMRAFAGFARRDCRSFDEVVDRFNAILSDMKPMGERLLGDRFGNHEIFLAGWSESRDRPEGYWEGAHGAWEGADGSLRLGGAVFLAGPLGAQAGILHRFGDDEGYIDPEKIEAFDAEMDGLEVIEAMRQETGPLDPGNPTSVIGHGVGGFVEHVTITRTGVDRRIIRVWPDEVGRRIEPAARQQPLGALQRWKPATPHSKQPRR